MFETRLGKINVLVQIHEVVLPLYRLKKWLFNRVERTEDGDQYFGIITINVVQDLEELNEDQKKG